MLERKKNASVKKARPLDSKSIARHAEILVIKGNPMTLKMGMPTILTEKG